MHQIPHHPAASPACKNIGLDLDAPEERARLNQAKQHMRDNTPPKVSARADVVKNFQPTASLADAVDISKSTLSSSARLIDCDGGPSRGRPPRAITRTPRTMRADGAVKCTTTLWGGPTPFSPDAMKRVTDAAPSADTGTGVALLTTTAGSHTDIRNEIALNLYKAECYAQLAARARDIGDKARSRNYEKEDTMQERYERVSSCMLFSVKTCS